MSQKWLVAMPIVTNALCWARAYGSDGTLLPIGQWPPPGGWLIEDRVGFTAPQVTPQQRSAEARFHQSLLMLERSNHIIRV